MPSHPAIIINAASGANDKESVRDQLAGIFRSRGLDARISLARHGSELTELVRRALHEDCRPIVAGGGDGTISAVASMLVGTNSTLGVLPLGTLNHFAKDMRIPLELEDAARVCIEGRAVNVDVGEVNGRVFLNNSSLGLYPSIVQRREKLQHRLGGGRGGKWPAFFWAAMAVLRRYPFLAVRLHADDRELVRRTPFIFVGNNEYEMESFNIGGRSCLDKGQLSLYTSRRTGRFGLLRFAIRALFGSLRHDKDFDALCTKEIIVETRRRHLRVATDGEVTLMNTPLHYRVRPGALRVLVPGTTDDSP